MKPFLTALVAMTLIASACGADDESIAIYTAADSGGEIPLAVGDRFDIELDSNPSTGHRWTIDDRMIPSAIELTSSTYIEPESDLVGAPGHERFSFEAVESGAGIVRFEYIRSSDDPVIPERVAEYIVRVDGAPWPPLTSDPPPPTTSVSVPEPDDVVAVESFFDGEGARDAVATGFVVWDAAGARLCDVLMESYPPQCGWAWLVLANPEALAVELQEAQGVRWTDDRVIVEVHFDGDRLVLGTDSTAVEPTSSDRELAEAFVEFATSGTGSDRLPLAEEVAIGLGSEIVRTHDRVELQNADAWWIDREEFRGYAGPFSALEVVRDPYAVTVGAHPRCAAPPVEAPAGFESSRRVSIQPTDATSCLEWWSVDFFLNNGGTIVAVTLDLHGP